MTEMPAHNLPHDRLASLAEALSGYVVRYGMSALAVQAVISLEDALCDYVLHYVLTLQARSVLASP
jgi:hypothetical protein